MLTYPPTTPLCVRDSAIIDERGEAVRLKGVNIGGWLTMENFITGYAANESMMRAAVRTVLGPDRWPSFARKATLFWEHRHFQDRVVHLWEAIADRYKRNAWVAGYNLMNEPADESRAVVGPVYDRLAAAVRAVDSDHVLFLDGNTYSTEFDFFAEPLDNAVYTLHDYVAAGLGRVDHYDRDAAERTFLERSAYARRTGTPLYVGEFAPIYTGDLQVDALRRQILKDQLDRYRRHDAGFATWM